MNSYTRLNHMVWAIDSILELEKPDLNNKHIFASIVYFLQIIGEAAKKVSPELKAQSPLVPWKKITALRNYVVHEYFQLDVDAVRLALTALPEIRNQIQLLVKKNHGK